MRASIISAALLGALGLATPVSAAGFGTPQTGAAIGTGSIGVVVGQIPVTSASFALLGCDVDNLEGPAVRFLQLGGSGLTLGDRSVFSVDDAEGLPCADVMSELLRAGFVIDDERLVVIGARNVIVYDLIVAR
jgi:hypothetical protein